MKLKKGDKVRVIAGANKGSEGLITAVLEDRVVVDGVNIRKVHLKPKSNGGTGEIVSREAPIHASNVMIIDPKTKKTTRIAHEIDKKGKKVRISVSSKEKLD